MWIRKSSSELTLDKRANLLRNIFWILLLWVGLWTVLSRFSPFLGRSLRDSAVALMGIALTGSILLIWRFSWQARKKSRNTLVCDRCNTVKSADGQTTCKCGGLYFNLLEMKWITPIPEKQPAKAANQMLASNAR